MWSPVSKKGMKLNHGLFFLQSKLASFNIRPEIISPSQSAALPTSLQSYKQNPTEEKEFIQLNGTSHKKRWQRAKVRTKQNYKFIRWTYSIEMEFKNKIITHNIVPKSENEYISFLPAFTGKARQLPWPCSWI